MGTLIFSYKGLRRLGSIFWVQNFEFQFGGGVRKINILGGYEDKIDWRYFGVHLKIGLYLGIILL